MSELQKALLAIGLGVIVAVYVFGWWQQRRYLRKFGTAFKASHADALYQGSDSAPADSLLPEAHVGMVDADSIDTIINQDAVADATLIEPPANNLLDDACALLNARSDFIIELRLAEPSHAAVLDGFWQRKFDFRKPVQVCGLPLGTHKWERAIAESPVLYSRLRVALQLVDRSGAISEAKLADFRDLVLGIATAIKADSTVPDIHETYRHAAELDGFCAEVDQMVGVNLIPPTGRLLLGARIAQVANLLSMTLEADGAFHLKDTQGHSRFSLSNQDSQPFQHLNLDTTSSTGITLLLDVPRVAEPGPQFDRMMQVAGVLAKELQVKMVDDHRVLLNDSGLALIREQINDVELKMCAKGLIPGSSQARRLFS